MRSGVFAGVRAAAVAVTIGLSGCGTQTDGTDPSGRDTASSEAVVAGSGVRAEATGAPDARSKAHAERPEPSASTRGAPQPSARTVGRTWRVVCGQGGPGLQSAIDAAASGDTIRVIGDCDEGGVVDGKDLSIEREPRAGQASEAADG
jgi:hypothetical protein